MSPSHACVVIMLIIRQGTGVKADLNWATVKKNVLTVQGVFVLFLCICGGGADLDDFCHTSELWYVAAVLSCHSGRHYAGRGNPEGFRGPAAGPGPSSRLRRAQMYFLGIAFWPFSQFNPTKSSERNNGTVRRHSQHFEKQILEQSRTRISWISPSSCFG